QMQPQPAQPLAAAMATSVARAQLKAHLTQRIKDSNLFSAFSSVLNECVEEGAFNKVVAPASRSTPATTVSTWNKFLSAHGITDEQARNESSPELARLRAKFQDYQ